MKDCFKSLNDYKRFRAMSAKENTLMGKDCQNEYELKRYKCIDQLELSMRGLQATLKARETNK